MGFFDPPPIAVRKRIPASARADFNAVEEFAENKLYSSKEQHKPYQLGIVLALWAKTNAQFGDLQLSDKDIKKMQSIYESCLRVIRGEAFDAFMTLSDLYDEGVIPLRQVIFSRSWP